MDIERVEQGVMRPATDAVAVEAGLEVRLAGDPFSVIMRTPGDDRALAAGFLFSEGIVRSQADLRSIEVIDEEQAVDVVLTDERAMQVATEQSVRRRVTMTSSCGLCGRPSLASIAVVAPVVATGWSVRADVISMLPTRLLDEQDTFAETGGIHAAALITRDGDLVSSAEDVGRHNAVDKIIGRMLLDGRVPLSSFVLFVSGRTSFEIVQKAWLAGVPVVAAVSAPSSLAIELATEAGITLVGFVRGDRFNVYAGAARIDGHTA